MRTETPILGREVRGFDDLAYIQASRRQYPVHHEEVEDSKVAGGIFTGERSSRPFRQPNWTVQTGSLLLHLYQDVYVYIGLMSFF